MDKTERIYFNDLDGLRFLAFFAVFLYHGLSAPFLILARQYKNPLTDMLVNGFFNQGENGVSFFFVLSGFLITYLLIREKETTGKISLKNFYLRRVLRIWPLYYLVLLVCFAVIPLVQQYIVQLGIQDVHENPWYYFSFFSNFDQLHLHRQDIASSPFLSITWSIAIEEQFYLAWPLLLLLIPRKYFPVFFLTVIAGSLAFRILHRQEYWTLYIHTFSVVSDLAIGGLLAYLMLYSPRFTAMIKDLPAYSIGLIYLAGTCCIFSGNIFFNFQVVRLVLPLFFAFVIAEQVLCRNSLFKMHRFTWLSKLGKYTYSGYLLHRFAIFIVFYIFRFMHLPAENIPLMLAGGAGALLLTLAMSYGSYRWVEKPFLNLKNRFT